MWPYLAQSGGVAMRLTVPSALPAAQTASTPPFWSAEVTVLKSPDAPDVPPDAGACVAAAPLHAETAKAATARAAMARDRVLSTNSSSALHPARRDRSIAASACAPCAPPAGRGRGPERALGTRRSASHGGSRTVSGSRRLRSLRLRVNAR